LFIPVKRKRFTGKGNNKPLGHFLVCFVPQPVLRGASPKISKNDFGFSKLVTHLTRTATPRDAASKWRNGKLDVARIALLFLLASSFL
jgi:hypothetical protein